jgi:hypothetical protein
MTTTMETENPLVGLAQELKRQLATKRDIVADTRRVSLSENGYDAAGSVPIPAMMMNVDMPDGAEAFGITRHAHQQVAEKIDVPWKTYDRLLGKHPDLLAHLGNGLLSREPQKRMLRVLDGNVRAVLSDRYRPRDNWDLLDNAILPEIEAFPGRVWFKACDLTETRLYVKVVFPDIEKPVTPRVGDAIRGGLIFQNSEVGDGSLGIYPYTDRLICLNGMVHTDFGQRTVHVGRRIESKEEAWEMFSDETLRLDDEAFFSKCRDTVRAVLNESVFEAIVSQMRDLAGIPVGGAPDAVVELFAKKHGLSEGERGSMLEALVDGADRSGWGYVNALTQTARDLDSADRRTEFETLAGKLASDNAWAVALSA